MSKKLIACGNYSTALIGHWAFLHHAVPSTVHHSTVQHNTMTEQATESSKSTTTATTSSTTASTKEIEAAPQSQQAQNTKNNDATTTTSKHRTSTSTPTSTVLRPMKKRCTSHSLSRPAPSKLVTLRVDVHHAGKTRLVDTLIFDSSCWPLPANNGGDFSSTSSSESPLKYPPFLQRNAYELAHHLISDMEVHGMGRTARHFTGRVDLYHGLNTFAPPLKGSSSKTTLASLTKSPPLLEKVVQQLLPQLQRVWDDYVVVVDTHKNRNGNRNIHSTPQEEGEEHKEAQSIDTSQMTTTTTTTTNPCTHNNNNTLRTIQIQLSIHGIMVMDEFQWDTQQHPHSCCPFEFAYQMTRDLKLPVDAAVPIATCIIEQLNDNVVMIQNSDSPSGTKTTTTTTTTDLPPIPTALLPPSLTTMTTLSNPPNKMPLSSPMSAAWTIDPREHIANISSMIHQQRPPGFSTTGTSK